MQGAVFRRLSISAVQDVKSANLQLKHWHFWLSGNAHAAVAFLLACLLPR